ncbi:MAG: head-tail connector protein [Cypionkella sp.]
MMLTEITSLPSAAFPVQAMKDHLRLGTGFGDDGLQDGLIEGHLRAAMAAIEGRIGKALLQRQFKLVLQDWRSQDEQALPVAPVSSILSVTVVDQAGAAVVLEPVRYRLVADLQRSKLVAVGILLPSVPAEGHVEVEFEAGFGPLWAAVPPDLAQAVLLLAAEFYENRNDQAQRSFGLPTSVQMLIERWRTVRVLGGGAA